MWVTRYSWVPLLSENINNTYFSFDLLKSKIFSIISNNLRKTDDLVKVGEEWTGKYVTSDREYSKFTFTVDGYNGYNVNSVVIKGYYWDEDEIKIDSLIECKANEETWLMDEVSENWVEIKNKNVVIQWIYSNDKFSETEQQILADLHYNKIEISDAI